MRLLFVMDAFCRVTAAVAQQINFDGKPWLAVIYRGMEVRCAASGEMHVLSRICSRCVSHRWTNGQTCQPCWRFV